MIPNTNAEINISGATIRFGDIEFLTDGEVQQNSLDKFNEENTILKNDLLMFATKDIFYDNQIFVELRDYRRSTGILTYAQAITHRLMTTRGTMPGDSSFGVPWDLFIGRAYSNKDAVVINLIQEISDEVARDNRTQGVSVSASFTANNAISVTCSVIPKGFRDPITISLNVGVT
jgi:hypothetical protein